MEKMIVNDSGGQCIDISTQYIFPRIEKYRYVKCIDTAHL